MDLFFARISKNMTWKGIGNFLLNKINESMFSSFESVSKIIMIAFTYVRFF